MLLKRLYGYRNTVFLGLWSGVNIVEIILLFPTLLCS